MSYLPSAAALDLRQQVRLLSGSDFWHTEAMPTLGVAQVMVSDGPHGLRAQLAEGDHLGIGGSEPATCFPPAVTLGSSWDPALAAEVGVALADEARDLGVGVVLGPGINIKRHPLGGRSFEYFSEDPLLTGHLAAAMVEGVQSRGVGTSLKHFAVNNQESHRFTVSAVVDDRTLRELYLRAFEIVVTQARPWTVMSSYNAVNGVLASQNHWLLNEVLRGEWGFDGLVMSDWGAVHDRVASIAAGLDLEMPGGASLSDREVLTAVGAGTLDPAAVATSAQRVLDLAARARPAHTASTEGPTPAVTAVDEHDALARRAAAAGAVLLSNDGLLPLAAGEDIALIGAFAETPRYQGAGSSSVVPTRVTSARDAFAERGIAVTWAPGYSLPRADDDEALIAEAVAVARAATVAVVMVGLPGAVESEGFDRDHLRLPTQHDRLVSAVCAANPRTVVVLSNGSPVLLPWRDRPAAILECYLGGQASGAALVDLLLGDAEPGGRLAESFPFDQTDIAADPWFPGEPRQVEHREGLFVGYRHHTTAGVAPAYAFGHGLSYTTFAWNDIALSVDALDVAHDGTVPPVEVTLTVANAGDRAGSDVVQVYRDDRTGVVLRPRRELAGFAKVHLEAGESRQVTVAIDGRSFAFWDAAVSGWRIPSGEMALEVARSSELVEATVGLVIRGGVTTSPENVHTAPLARTDEQFSTRLGRPLPTPSPSLPLSRDSTIEELEQTRGGRLVAAALERAMRSKVSGSGDEPGEGAEMFDRSMRQIPLRAIASFAGGAMSWPIVDTLVDLAQGRVGSVVIRGAKGVRRRARRR